MFALLRSLDLPLGDYAIFGSGPLMVRGIIEGSNDLDIITRGATWNYAQEHGNVTTFEDGNLVVEMFDGRISFGNSWKYGRFDLNQLIETAELIDHLPFVRLQHVITYKQTAGRVKDREHLTLLADWTG